MSRKYQLGLSALALSLCMSPLQAATITVDTLNDELNNDGDCSLREALESANTDTGVDDCDSGAGADVINIPAGTISLTSGQMTLSTDIDIRGAGMNDTVIDAQSGSRIFNVTDSSGVAYSTIIIDGLTLTNGDSGTFNGGAIYSIENLAVSNLKLESNTAANGGGLYIQAGIFDIDSVYIKNNRATATGVSGVGNQGGGGLFVSSSLASGSIKNSAFIGNHSNQHSGAIWFQAGDLDISNTTLSGNSADSCIGGILVTGNTATFNNVTIVENSARNCGAGAGIYAWSGGGSLNASLRNSIVSGNLVNASAADLYGQGGHILSRGFNLYTQAAGSITSTANPGTDIVSQPHGLLGLTETDTTAYHNARTGSLAVEAGNDLVAPGSGGDACEATDQRGIARPNGACDIGAVVLNPTDGLGFITPAYLAATEGELVNFTIQVDDGGAASVDIRALDIPDRLTLDDNGDGTASITGFQVLSVDYQITLEVEDDTGFKVSKTFTVIVKDEDDVGAPVLGLITDTEETGSGFTKTEESGGATGLFGLFMLSCAAWYRRRRS
jgi:CSLREA domain-containing protein